MQLLQWTARSEWQPRGPDLQRTKVMVNRTWCSEEWESNRFFFSILQPPSKIQKCMFKKGSFPNKNIIILYPVSSLEPLLLSSTKASRKSCNISSSPSPIRLKTTYLSNCALGKREYPGILRIVMISWHWYLNIKIVIMAPLLACEPGVKSSPRPELAHSRSNLSMDWRVGHSPSPQMYN